jgi:hypothetical protein
MTDEEIETTIERISTIRAKNNLPWMAILKIALKRAPVETKAALAEILVHDMSVCKHVRELIQQ